VLFIIVYEIKVKGTSTCK